MDCPNDFSLTGDTLSFLIKMESSYNCAGICEVPLFFLSKDISLGPPKQECVNAILTQSTEEIKYTGLIILITGCIILSIFISSLFLCSTVSDHEQAEYLHSKLIEQKNKNNENEKLKNEMLIR